MKRIQRLIRKVIGTPHDNCYIASEALYHLCGGKAAGYKPVQGRHEGVSHWWLEYRGKVVDLTADQFNTPVDYAKGRGRGFLTGQPSHRAQRIISQVERLLVG